MAETTLNCSVEIKVSLTFKSMADYNDFKNMIKGATGEMPTGFDPASSELAKNILKKLEVTE